MKHIAIFAAAALLLGACSTKTVRVGGMMCPEGYTTEQINHDLRECRFFGPEELKAAQKASLPKEVEPECVKCLEAKGYKIVE